MPPLFVVDVRDAQGSFPSKPLSADGCGVHGKPLLPSKSQHLEMSFDKLGRWNHRSEPGAGRCFGH